MYEDHKEIWKIFILFLIPKGGNLISRMIVIVFLYYSTNQKLNIYTDKTGKTKGERK